MNEDEQNRKFKSVYFNLLKDSGTLGVVTASEYYKEASNLQLSELLCFAFWEFSLYLMYKGGHFKTWAILK